MQRVYGCMGGLMVVCDRVYHCLQRVRPGRCCSCELPASCDGNRSRSVTDRVARRLLRDDCVS
jgi:hypothetical protein